MRIEAQLQLLARIEEALALADAERAHEVALWLDRARIAAGGPGEIGDTWPMPAPRRRARDEGARETV